jgi:hypothetical protein
MSYPRTLKITKIDRHRNGVAGEPFYVVLFREREGNQTRRMIATVFDAPGAVSVFDINELVKENIGFGEGNSWRGDHYELRLRKAITEHEQQTQVSA